MGRIKKFSIRILEPWNLKIFLEIQTYPSFQSSYLTASINTTSYFRDRATILPMETREANASLLQETTRVRKL